MKLPFLAVPQFVVNNENQEKRITTRIQPDQICNYYPGFNWGTVVVFNSGGSMLLDCTVEDFEEALRHYSDTVLNWKPGCLDIAIYPPAKPITHEAN